MVATPGGVPQGNLTLEQPQMAERKFKVTMVAGPARDYPTQTYSCTEPVEAGASHHKRRKAYRWTQGESNFVSEALANRLREKRHPIARGPLMFKIEIIEPPKAKVTRAPSKRVVDKPAAEPEPEAAEPEPEAAEAKPKSARARRSRSRAKPKAADNS